MLCTALHKQTFSGVGRTKKRAKQFAAEAALSSFITLQHPQPVQRYADDDDERRRRGILAAEDFTNDDVNDIQLAVNVSRLNTSAASRFPQEPYGRFRSKSRRARRLDRGPRKDAAATRDVPSAVQSSTRHRWWNPVAVLSDLRPNIQYSRDSDAGNDDSGGRPQHETVRGRHHRRAGAIAITAVVDGQRFHGRGRTPKQAKRCLAADALRTLFHFRFVGQKPGSSTQERF